MNGLYLDPQELFGLFELDQSGNVIYARLEPNAGDGNGDGKGDGKADGKRDGKGDGKADGKGDLDLTGHNIFEEMATFGDAPELWLKISSFAQSNIEAESFNFTFRANRGYLDAKILLARTPPKSNGDKSILVQIRKA